MPIGKGNIFSWIAPSFTLHLTILERKNYALHTHIPCHFHSLTPSHMHLSTFTLQPRTLKYLSILQTPSQPHTLTHLCTKVQSPLLHTHLDQYILHCFTASHMYLSTSPHHITASHPHTSQYISHCFTHSHPRTCISVHSPITSHPHTSG